MKANRGAAGVDGQSIADFEVDLSNNLYKLWNRLSSGSYFASPVRRDDIPKADSGTRPVGIPTVGERIAQEVARRNLEPRLEPMFHVDSYGYCEDMNRQGGHAHTSFDFLEFTFRARKTMWHGHIHTHSFLPAVSRKALKTISPQ